MPLEDVRGGEGKPRATENSELARLCLDCWLRGLETPESAGFSKFADEMARRRRPLASCDEPAMGYMSNELQRLTTIMVGIKMMAGVHKRDEEIW